MGEVHGAGKLSTSIATRKQGAKEEAKRKGLGIRYSPQGYVPFPTQIYPEACYTNLVISQAN